MKGSIRDILLATVVGDALGTPLDGLGKGHIRAHFMKAREYIDPAPGLKGKMHRWRKPGLYSSISQFMLILAARSCRRGPLIESFIRSIEGAPFPHGAPCGIFRGPGEAERGFIMAARGRAEEYAVPALPCTRIIPSLAPLSFTEATAMERATDVIGYLRLFTLDYATIAAGLLYSFLIDAREMEESGREDLIEGSVETAGRLAGMIEKNSASVFEGGANPATLVQALLAIRDTLSALVSVDNAESAGMTISSRLSAGLASPITRATVNMPGALLPYAVYLSARTGNDPMILFLSAKEGGHAAPLASMTGALSAGWFGARVVPDALVTGLVNRKGVISLIDAVSSRRVPPSLTDDFIRSEASLTVKEIQELSAKCRHGGGKPPRKPLTRKEMELSLSRHMVESWTKIDRARWKKERKRLESEEGS